MSPQEMIDVIQAHKDGKKIEFLRKTENLSSEGCWIIAKIPSWNFTMYNYRIVPEAPKTMHQYLLSSPSEQYIPTPRFYSSIENATRDYKDSLWTVIKRLDYTEITITE